MNSVLKRALIAAALLVFCGAVLAATKHFGVWVISAIAVCLFALGILKRGKTDASGGDRDAGAGDPPQGGQTP